MPHANTTIIYAYGADGPDWGGRPQQIQRCQAYAARHHLQVLDVVSEAKSAGPTLSRPAFGALFTALTTQSSPPSALLITEMTRLGRSMDLHEIGGIEYRLRRAGIQIIEADGVACQGYDSVRQVPMSHRAMRNWVRELIARCPT